MSVLGIIHTVKNAWVSGGSERFTLMCGIFPIMCLVISSVILAKNVKDVVKDNWGK